jgi:hypothetical protein
MQNATTAAEMSGLWSDFLVGSQRVFSKLAAASTSGRSSAWFGRIKNARKNDPLLQYIHQARHADEHGLEPIAKANSRSFGIDAANRDLSLRINHLQIARGAITKLDAENAYLSFTPADAILHPVTNDGRTYAPPITHLDKPWTENNARAVAKAALTFMEQTVADGANYLID